MGIGKTFVIDCDMCKAELTDSDGIYTAGREAWIIEHAEDAGWKFDQGWYCGACWIEKNRPAAPESVTKEESK